MSRKTINKKNQKIYYGLIAIVIIAIAICTLINPDIITQIANNNTQTTNTNTSPTNLENNDNRLVSTIGGDIVYNTELPLDDGLRMHFIDVGQGDSIYIEFPDGQDMLIDAGSTTSTKNEKKFIDGTSISGANSELVSNYIAKYNDDNVIDYLMITHPDSDHYNLLGEVFEDYQINNVYLPYASIDYADTEATANEKDMFTGGKNITTKGFNNILKDTFSEPSCTVMCDLGCFDIEISEEITFKVYSFGKSEYETYGAKSNSNEISPICVLEYANRKIVLTGDAEFKSEEDYLRDSPTVDCDVLKAGHHGSHSSSSDDFLDDITCEYAIISAGIASYGHPHDVTLDKYKKRNIQYFCTITYGTIVLKVDNTGDMTFVSAKNVA